MVETPEDAMVAKVNQWLADNPPNDWHARAEKAEAQLAAVKEQRDRLNEECERWLRAYKIAHEQATENGEAAAKAKADRDRILAMLEPSDENKKAVLEGLWPIVGGSHQPAEFWGHAEDAVFGTLTYLSTKAKDGE